jgi:hypothetical protein
VNKSKLVQLAEATHVIRARQDERATCFCTRMLLCCFVCERIFKNAYLNKAKLVQLAEATKVTRATRARQVLRATRVNAARKVTEVPKVCYPSDFSKLLKL